MTKQNIVILGLETSCDETAAAVVKNGNEILSNVVSSQVDVHRRFGGVVPEVASRKHLESMNAIIEQALTEADRTVDDLDAVAVTQGPGLVGALLVGVSAAKALAFARDLPLIAVHHIAGHIYATQLVREMMFPSIALVVSGGHSDLYYMERHDHYRMLGQTRDDAAGEAYDKIARALGLPYPGGPQIARLAQEGRPEYSFPRAWLEPDSYDFSFSGLKSSVLNRLHQAEQKGETVRHADLAFGFQEAVLDVLIEKTIKAVRHHPVQQLVLAGGVAANQTLRSRLEERAADAGVPLAVPPISLCTDNAAMIAAAAYPKYVKQEFADMALNASAGLPLTEG